MGGLSAHCVGGGYGPQRNGSCHLPPLNLV
jgi:hypothetical protein